MSTGFSKQEYWSGLPFPSPEDLPSSEIEPTSPTLAGRLSFMVILINMIGVTQYHNSIITTLGLKPLARIVFNFYILILFVNSFDKYLMNPCYMLEPGI